MKILHVCTSDRGGAAKACIRLHEGLRALGVDSKVLVLKRADPNAPEVHSLEDFYNAQNILHKIKRLWQQRGLEKRRTKLLKNRPLGYDRYTFTDSIHDLTAHPLYAQSDIIHFHWVNDLLDWDDFFSKNRKPLAWTMHDLSPFSGGYAYEQGFPMEAYKDLIEKQVAQKTRLLSSTKLAAIGPSRWMFEQIAASPVLAKARRHHIPYGLNTKAVQRHPSIFACEVLGLPANRKLILCVADGMNNRRKGFDLLIQALQSLKNAYVDLVLIGSKIPEVAGLPNVHRLGWIHDERLLALAYSAADVFVAPSVDDNLPNTVMESLCCGTPVVGFRIGGLPDLVESEADGFLSAEVDAEGLAQCLRRALQTDFDNAAIQARASAKYDQLVQARAYKSVYSDLVKR